MQRYAHTDVLALVISADTVGMKHQCAPARLTGSGDLRPVLPAVLHPTVPHQLHPQERVGDVTAAKGAQRQQTHRGARPRTLLV